MSGPEPGSVRVDRPHGSLGSEVHFHDHYGVHFHDHYGEDTAGRGRAFLLKGPLNRSDLGVRRVLAETKNQTAHPGEDPHDPPKAGNNT